MGLSVVGKIFSENKGNSRTALSASTPRHIARSYVSELFIIFLAALKYLFALVGISSNTKPFDVNDEQGSASLIPSLNTRNR